MAKLTHVTDSDFEQQVLKSEIPVIVDFWAEWCGPCVAFGPTFERVSGEYEGKVKFAKLDVQNNPQTATSYGIMAIPAMLAFKDGKVAEQVTGMVDEATVAKLANALLED